MNEPLNSQINNDFFYKKDKGSNENAEKEINHLMYKSYCKVRTIYIMQFFEIISMILSYIFSPTHIKLLKDSSGKIILYSLIFGTCIAVIFIIYMILLWKITEIDEYNLLSNKRECKGIVEVLQDYFYKDPYDAFRVSDFNHTSWMDVSGKFSLKDSSAEKLYLVLFIKPNVQKRDEDNKLGNVEYSIPSYSLNSYKHYVKVGNSEPLCFKYGYFWFFAAFGLAGLYLFYVRSYIKHKEFTVKKIFNKIDDFKTAKNKIGYDKYIPGISINGKEFLYDSSLTGGERKVYAVQKNLEPNNAEIELNYKVKVNL